MCKCITRKICSGHSGLKPKSKERKKRANQNCIWTKGWQPRGRDPKNCREVPHSGEWGHQRFLLFSCPPHLTHKKSWWFYSHINYPKAYYFSPLQLLPHCCKANHHLSSGSWQIILLSNLHTAARVSCWEWNWDYVTCPLKTIQTAHHLRVKTKDYTFRISCVVYVTSPITDFISNYSYSLCSGRTDPLVAGPSSQAFHFRAFHWPFLLSILSQIRT